MAVETENTRNVALSLLEAKGMEWRRVGKGQRFVIHAQNDQKTIRVLVKVASRGSAMVRTDIDDAEKAVISGFSSDVDSVLFAVGGRDNKEISAYLVPIKEVEEAYRSTHGKWRAKRPTGTKNMTWVIWFNDSGDADCNDFHQIWEHYCIGTYSTSTMRVVDSERQMVVKGISIEEAKAGLATYFNVNPNNVKIAIEY